MHTPVQMRRSAMLLVNNAIQSENENEFLILFWNETADEM